MNGLNDRTQQLTVSTGGFHGQPAVLRPWKPLALAALWLAGWPVAGWAQVAPPVILEVDIDSFVQYFGDATDYTKFGSDPNPTSPAPRTFQSALILGDIVAVNGKPAKGGYVARGQVALERTAPAPGQAVSDIQRNGPVTERFEIMQADGTPVGTIMTIGQTAGSPPPGSPAALTQSNLAIVGGTGAFLGARGQVGVVSIIRNPRNAYFTEDPANRRVNGGGLFRFVLYLIPMSRPEIAASSSGPAVVHSSDFKLVSASNPAHPGEILSLFATGLGPVRPNVEPGKPFPASPLAAVNSPMDVLVNGASTEMLAAAGYPGSTDGYQVNFRVPGDTPKGTAALQVSAAWITSSTVQIVIQ
jgi:hypothetical protein